MRYLTLLILAIITASCGTTKTVHTERSVELDTVLVPVYRPPVEHTKDVVIRDSIVLDLPEVRISMTRIPLPEREPGSAVDTTQRDSFRVDVEVKADTVQAEVQQKTIREKKHTVEEKRVMAWWGWLLIGALLILLIVAFIK